MEDNGQNSSQPQPGQMVQPHQTSPVAEANQVDSSQSASPPAEPSHAPSPAPITDQLQPASTPEPTFVGEVEDTDDESYNSFSWQASEFIHHEKKPTWFFLLYGAIGVLVLGAALLRQWFTMAVFATMGGALAVYSNKPPRVLNYSLTSAGINIDSKFYPYTQFRSFAVINDVAWHAIDLEPAQRFMPRLTVLFDSEDLDTIVDILTEELPRVDRQPDVIERITRTLRF